MFKHEPIDLSKVTNSIKSILGTNDGVNGGVVKAGKFYQVSIVSSRLSKFSETPSLLTGSDVRMKNNGHVVHVHLNKTTKRFVIKSSKPEALVLCVQDGI